MKLRTYQAEAVASCWQHIQSTTTNPCIEAPTGAGKSLIIAQLVKDVIDWSGRVLILCHRKELIEQNAEKIKTLAPMVDVGIYSAGLSSRDTEHSCIVAGIQSVHGRADELGAFDVILVDEAHLIPADGDGMFLTFLTHAKLINPAVRVVGLTATPYRLKEGLVCGPDRVLNTICHSIPIKPLIADGYLSPLISKHAEAQPDLSEVAVRAGEYVASQLNQELSDGLVVAEAVAEMLSKTTDRKSVLIFCAGREHASQVAEMIAFLAPEASVAMVDGLTSPTERASTLAYYKEGAIKYLINIDVLTTGFDAPNIDCVAMLRPTLSPGLYYQMCGRGLRVAPGKANCLILDFGGNIERHGPIDKMAIKPKPNGSGKNAPPAGKHCKACREVVPISVAVCPECGEVFEVDSNPTHDTEASVADILSQPPKDYEVEEVSYSEHTKKGADDTVPKTLRVDYHIECLQYPISEWVCVEHSGYGLEKALAWWAKRSDQPCPQTARAAAKVGNSGQLKEPSTISVDISGKFDSIKKHSNLMLPAIPETEENQEDDIPF